MSISFKFRGKIWIDATLTLSARHFFNGSKQRSPNPLREELQCHPRSLKYFYLEDFEVVQGEDLACILEILGDPEGTLGDGIFFPIRFSAFEADNQAHLRNESTIAREIQEWISPQLLPHGTYFFNIMNTPCEPVLSVQNSSDFFVDFFCWYS